MWNWRQVLVIWNTNENRSYNYNENKNLHEKCTDLHRWSIVYVPSEWIKSPVQSEPISYSIVRRLLKPDKLLEQHPINISSTSIKIASNQHTGFALYCPRALPAALSNESIGSASFERWIYYLNIRKALGILSISWKRAKFSESDALVKVNHNFYSSSAFVN